MHESTMSRKRAAKEIERKLGSLLLGGEIGFSVEAGGFLLNAQQKTRGASVIYADQAETQPVVSAAQSFNASKDVTSNINQFNFGLTGGIGFTQGVGSGGACKKFCVNGV